MNSKNNIFKFCLNINHVWRCISVLFSLLLFSCARGPSPLDPVALQKRGLQPDEGLLVGTFNTKNVNYKGEPMRFIGGMPQVGLSLMGDKDLFTIGGTSVIQDKSTTSMVTGAGYPYDVYAIPVKAGTYDIFDWYMIWTNYSVDVRLSSKSKISVPVKVKPGEAVYIGNIDSVAVFGRTIIGIPILGDGMVMIKNDFQKDSYRIASKYAVIKKNQIKDGNVASRFLLEQKRVAQTPDTRWKLFR